MSKATSGLSARYLNVEGESMHCRPMGSPEVVDANLFGDTPLAALLRHRQAECPRAPDPWPGDLWIEKRAELVAPRALNPTGPIGPTLAPITSLITSSFSFS